MDDDVKAALVRWPNVPAVAGWLSLDGRGRWHLHPQGDAAGGGPGESITNTQILAFIERNYEHDDQGRWYFQNGPQRVYVRIDAAPYILRGAERGAGLHTHTRREIQAIRAWWLDETGLLYASTDAGPGVIEDRDLAGVIDTLTLADGTPLWDHLESPAPGDAALHLRHPAFGEPAPLLTVPRAELPARLGFVAQPAV